MRVTHSRGEYEVLFGSVEQALELAGNCDLCVTDANIARFYGGRLDQGKTLVFPAGEETKSLESFGVLVNEFARRGVKRSGRVAALGGGVIGDLVGYAAAAYMRGIEFVQIPTTLLAQVDSSVGGKVGIDLPAGKNLVGAFHPPSQVQIAVEFLDTLEPRQLTNGMAEVLKYGFIMSPSLLSDVQPGSTDFESVVRTCVDLKRQVVEEDEHEITGLRAILNFGHTVGHALEKLLNYQELLHGEAISIGMVVEAHLGESLGVTAAGTTAQVRELLLEQGLPVEHPLVRKTDEMIAAMWLDKKASGTGLAFSLLESVGRCKLVKDVSPDYVRAALNSV